MNLKKRLKTAFIQRSLDKRMFSYPFIVDAAEHFSLPPDADDNQNNSHYFSGHDLSGNSLLFRYAKRGKNKTEIWFAYKDADGNAFVNENQLCIEDDMSAGVKCKEPGRALTFHYDGDLRELSSGKLRKARFTGTFSSTGDIFEFGHHLDSRILAKAIAQQKWSKAFFRELRENDQVHYEQPGVIKGMLSIGQSSIDLSLPAMRDHSFGKRDWGYMNRHFWLMALLEDGSYLNANMVSYPILRELQTGYFVSDKGTACIDTAKVLGDIVPNAVPESFTYRVRLLNGDSLNIQCSREMQFIFPFSQGRYTIYEGIGTFDLNGVKGRGVLEFGWNGDSSRYA
ncbi:MAG: DUF7064 domain-containing protein [Christensenellales bacterium]|jgi:hypothetical protein